MPRHSTIFWFGQVSMSTSFDNTAHAKITLILSAFWQERFPFSVSCSLRENWFDDCCVGTLYHHITTATIVIASTRSSQFQQNIQVCQNWEQDIPAETHAVTAESSWMESRWNHWLNKKSATTVKMKNSPIVHVHILNLIQTSANALWPNLHCMWLQSNLKKTFSLRTDNIKIGTILI